MSTKIFCFDLYGTLLDIRTDEWSGRFWNRIAHLLNAPNGQSVHAAYLRLAEEAQAALPPLGEIDLIEIFQKLLAEFHCTLDAGAFASEFRALSRKRCRPFIGIRSMLRELRASGAKLYIFSNAQACFTHAEIDRSDLRKYFDGVLLSSEIGFKKPSPHFFERACRTYGLDPKTCVYVGNDLRDDVSGARGVGMRSVYIETEQSGKYSEPYATDMVASDFVELKKILLRLARE